MFCYEYNHNHENNNVNKISCAYFHHVIQNNLLKKFSRY
jgi:hypothetical protein